MPGRKKQNNPVSVQHLQQNPYNMPQDDSAIQGQINVPQHQEVLAADDINPPVKGAYQQNPYIHGHQYQPNPIRNDEGHPHLNMNQPYPHNQVQINNGDQHIQINNAPQTIVIVNQNAKPTENEDTWKRKERVGCCCISIHHHSCWFDYYCINSCCNAIQARNLCCYCHSMDCIRCCVHHACRTCCFQKQLCECMLQCCKHMPLCLLIDCLKNCGACQAICQCLGNCAFGCICEALKGCDCSCIRGICEVVCQILFCFCK